MKVLHLIRPESGPWEEEVASLQAGQGDAVVVLRWCDENSGQAACEVVSRDSAAHPGPGTTISYEELLDLLFDSDRVCSW